MADTTATSEKAIERKYLAHYLDCSPTSTATYERIGKDLEELNIDMNLTVDTKNNILGETSVKAHGYQPSAEVDPYIARKGSKTFDYLQGLIDNRAEGDDLKTDTVEVHTWEEAKEGKYTAYKDECYVEIKSYGGNTDGYQIPYTLHYTNVRTKGTFDPTTKTFTAA